MGFSLDISVPALTVFIQGLVSFFSPCVLPLIPLYIGYLSGGTGKRGEDGRMHYERSKVMLHTLCFVIGVSFAFFLLDWGSPHWEPSLRAISFSLPGWEEFWWCSLDFISWDFLVRAEPWERSTGCLLSWICWPCRQ